MEIEPMKDFDAEAKGYRAGIGPALAWDSSSSISLLRV